MALCFFFVLEFFSTISLKSGLIFNSISYGKPIKCHPSQIICFLIIIVNKVQINVFQFALSQQPEIVVDKKTKEKRYVYSVE